LLRYPPDFVPGDWYTVSDELFWLESGSLLDWPSLEDSPLDESPLDKVRSMTNWPRWNCSTKNFCFRFTNWSRAARKSAILRARLRPFDAATGQGSEIIG
jgi:hypothetical protein